MSFIFCYCITISLLIDCIISELERGLTEEQIKIVCYETCLGLQYLHQHHIIHRDLKAGNILLTMDGEVKLGNAHVLIIFYSMILSTIKK